MRNQLFKITAIALVAFVAFAFVERPATVYKVSTQESTLVWTGKKVTGEHTGNINLASGSLTYDGKNLKEGTFDIDITSLTVTDVKDAEYNKNLVNHLKNTDFFDAANFPKATFVLTSATAKGGNNFLVKGKLTIKGITNDIEFPAVIKNENKKVVATAKIVVDRTKYDIKYKSNSFFENLGDKAIYDEFELDVKLVAASTGV